MIEYPIKILLIEDNPADVILIKHQLKKVLKNPKIHHVSRFEDFKISLQFLKPDLLISDYLLAGFSGLDVLKYVEEHDPDLPFVFVTSTMSDQKLAESTILNKVSFFVLKNNVNKLHKQLFPLLESIVNKIIQKNLSSSEKVDSTVMQESLHRIHENHIKRDQS